MTSQQPRFTWWDSLQCALSGWRVAFLSERNLRIHVVIACWVVVLGTLLSVSRLEWIFLVLMTGSMLTIEMVNTAIERTVDLACNQEAHPLAKTAKDISAGACLITALTAVVLGLMIFGPKLMTLIVTKL